MIQESEDEFEIKNDDDDDEKRFLLEDLERSVVDDVFDENGSIVFDSLCDILDVPDGNESNDESPDYHPDIIKDPQISVIKVPLKSVIRDGVDDMIIKQIVSSIHKIRFHVSHFLALMIASKHPLAGQINEIHLGKNWKNCVNECN